MLFPFMQDVQVSDSENVTTYSEYDIDFETGRLTGKIVTDKKALKVWIYKALKTRRYIHDIYSWDYGHDLEELIGQGYEKGFIDSEVVRRINDCLLVNEKIDSCTNFEITFINDKLYVTFTANTIYGEVEVSV